MSERIRESTNRQNIQQEMTATSEKSSCVNRTQSGKTNPRESLNNRGMKSSVSKWMSVRPCGEIRVGGIEQTDPEAEFERAVRRDRNGIDA